MRALRIAPLLLAACSSVSTSYDFDPEADFSKLGGYAWVKADKESDPLVMDRVRKAVDAELTARGYAPVVSPPSFKVAAHLRSRRRVMVRDTGPTGGYRGWGYGHWNDRRIDVYDYEEGSLILDIVDAKSNRLIWRGVARAALSDDPKPEETTKIVNEAVTKLLQDFPPPAK